MSVTIRYVTDSIRYVTVILYVFSFLFFLFFSFQAHNDLIRTYEAKLQSFGVPTEELGFKPLESNVGGQQLGRGPAGLVAAPT